MKDIKGYEGLYAVTRDGQVYSYRRKIYLKPNKTKCGYSQVMLCVDGNKEALYIHRLVAEAFIENPKGLDTVNHINHNKEDNRVENLEWMSFQDNLQDGINQNKKQVKCLDTGEIFESIAAAAKSKGLHTSGIAKAAKGFLKTSGKLHWQYV